MVQASFLDAPLKILYKFLFGLKQLPSLLHVKIKRAPAHSKKPLKLQNHDPRNEHIRQLSQLQPQAQILLGRSNHFRRRKLH